MGERPLSWACSWQNFLLTGDRSQFLHQMCWMLGSTFGQGCRQAQAPILAARYQDAQCGVLGRPWTPAAWQRTGRCCRWGGEWAEAMLKSQQAPFPPLLPHLWVHASSGEDSTWVSLSTLVQARSVGGKRRERLLLGSLPWAKPEENQDLFSFGHILGPRLLVPVALLALGGDTRRPSLGAAPSGKHALTCTCALTHWVPLLAARNFMAETRVRWGWGRKGEQDHHFGQQPPGQKQ